jgi:hypothetical protein
VLDSLLVEKTELTNFGAFQVFFRHPASQQRLQWKNLAPLVASRPISERFTPSNELNWDILGEAIWA